MWRRELRFPASINCLNADETWLSSRAQRGICFSLTLEADPVLFGVARAARARSCSSRPTKSRSLVATLLGMTIALRPASSAFKQFQACSNTELSTLIARTVAAIPKFHEEPNFGVIFVEDGSCRLRQRHQSHETIQSREDHLHPLNSLRGDTARVRAGSRFPDGQRPSLLGDRPCVMGRRGSGHDDWQGAPESAELGR